MTVLLRTSPRFLNTAKAPNYMERVSCVDLPRAAVAQPKALRADAVLKGMSVREWLDAECDGFKGMQAVRSQTWDIQGIVDGLYDAGAFGQARRLKAKIPVGANREDGDPPLDAAIRASAAQLLDPLVGFGLPAEFTEQVQRDAEEIGVTVAELIPATDKLTLQLELIRENCCTRWHQDNIVARAIVSYNCSGTEYIHDDSVNFWELDNCGNNDCVVNDRTTVCQAGVGDILLMKGKLFPGALNGLVHRSPSFAYHPDGGIKARFVLKVDVRTTDQAGSDWLSCPVGELV
jgi:hypothetical protein